MIQSDLRWNQHTDNKINKAKRLHHQLHRLRNPIHPTTLLTLYTLYIRPILEYGTLVLSTLSKAASDGLERLQRRAAYICLRLPLFQPVGHSSLLYNAKLHTLSSRRHYRRLTFAHTLMAQHLHTCALTLSTNEPISARTASESTEPTKSLPPVPHDTETHQSTQPHTYSINYHTTYATSLT